MNVLIYDSKSCQFQSQLVSLFQKLLCNYDVKRCKKFDLIENTKLIVIPGGRDKEFLEEIGEKGIRNIRNYVSNGGNYLGICAGAYLACSYIKFEVDRPDYKVEGKRPLEFFPGLGIGSVTEEFTYNSEAGAEAKKLILDDTTMHGYVNGGLYFDMNGVLSSDVKVMAKYDDGNAAIVDCAVENGHAILSGVHIEVTAEYVKQLINDMTGKPEDIAKLKELLPLLEKHDSERCHLLKSILEKLGLEVFEQDTSNTPIWISSLQDKEYLKHSISTLKVPIEIKFYESESLALFNFSKYFNQVCLNPESNFGKTLLYAERITSTHTLLESLPDLTNILPDGTIFHASHQTTGRGRGSNHWISQNGCLQFSISIRHTHAPSLIFLQYLYGLALCRYFNSTFGLDCRLKWPNDIYIQGTGLGSANLMKVGGILVTSTYENSSFKVLIGSGINVLNPKPSTCLQQFTKHKLEMEVILAGIISVFETMYHELLAGDDSDPFGQFRNEYYKYWLHTNQTVNIQTETGMQDGVIRGLDPTGFLKARLATGEMVLLQPDGNSFDMLKGLITVKL